MQETRAVQALKVSILSLFTRSICLLTLWPLHVKGAEKHLAVINFLAQILNVVSILVVGAGHLASWNTEFAEENGRALWRIFSIIYVCANVLTFISPSKCYLSLHYAVSKSGLMRNSPTQVG